MSLVITFAVGRSPSPIPPVVNAAPVAAIAEESPDDETDQMRENRAIAHEILRKSNNLASTEPKTVKPEKIAPVPPAVAESKVETSVKEQKKAESDICTRQGKRKVRHGRRGWRCKK